MPTFIGELVDNIGDTVIDVVDSIGGNKQNQVAADAAAIERVNLNNAAKAADIATKIEQRQKITRIMEVAVYTTLAIIFLVALVSIAPKIQKLVNS